jgi:hypothetical protein
MLCTLICTLAFITGTFTGVLVADIRRRSYSPWHAKALVLLRAKVFEYSALATQVERY